MNAWRRVPLVSLCEAHVDCVNRTAPVVDEPTPYKMIRTTNVRDGFIDTTNVRYVTEETYRTWTRRLVPRRGDIILTREAPLGGVGKIRSDDSIFLGQRLYHFRADPKRADGDFLMYSLMAADLQQQIRSFGSGSTVEHMRLPDIEKLEINAPDLEEQRRIGAMLAAYDDLIENCERRIRVLDEMARALYREWFVLFRYPGHEKTTLVDSAPGRIPKGWTHGPIREVYSGLFDGPHATPAPATEGPIFLGIGNMTESGRLDLSSIRHIAEADFDRWTKRVTPQAGDIVFTYEATLHRYALIPDDFRGCLGRRLALIRVDPAKKCGRFLFLTLLSEAWHEVVSKNTLSGATVDRVPLSKLPEFPIVRPPMPLVAQFDDAVQPIIDDQMRLSKLIVNLRCTRDLLLPRLLSGQLAVEDAA